MPARVGATVQTRRGWAGRGWTILKGGNRDGLLTARVVALSYGDLSARGAA